MMREFNSRPHFLCSELVEARCVDPGGRGYTRTANLGEIWRAGALLEFETAIPERAVIRLQVQSREYRGRVESCRSDVLGYTVEMKFAPDCRWDRDQCEPDHLFDPLSLLPGAQEIPALAVLEDCA